VSSSMASLERDVTCVTSSSSRDFFTGTATRYSTLGTGRLTRLVVSTRATLSVTLLDRWTSVVCKHGTVHAAIVPSQQTVVEHPSMNQCRNCLCTDSAVDSVSADVPLIHTATTVLRRPRAVSIGETSTNPRNNGASSKSR